MKKIVIIFTWLIWFGAHSASPSFGYDYQLYKNNEDFGIVVFPKAKIFPKLDDFIKSIIFKKVASGKAVMRYGSKGENETLMMPMQVQKKHSIEKFMVIQVMTPSRMLIAVFDPEWGLTLPSTVFGLEDMKKNIPKTLHVFRGDKPRKEILWDLRLQPGPKDRTPFMNPGFRGVEI